MSRSRNKAGRPSNGPPEGQAWVWLTEEMITTTTFRALGLSARRLLDFLLLEHMAHGGNENGDLKAPYRQLKRFGVTENDIPGALAELMATGFIRRTAEGFKSAGATNPALYALTWLPTGRMCTPQAQHATHDWRTVRNQLQHDLTDAGDDAVLKVKAWLKGETAASRRPKPTGRKNDAKDDGQNQNMTPRMQGAWPPECKAVAA